MVGSDHNKISLSDILVLPFSKRTLPAKIIQLRRVSQDNHVRRMKIAHERKQMRPPSDACLNLSSNVPRKNVSNFQTPFTTPNTRLDAKDAEYNYSLDKNPCSSSTRNRNNFSQKILPSSCRRKDFHSRFTHVKTFENSFDFNKREVKSDTSITYRESSLVKYSPDFKDTTPIVFAKSNKQQKQTDVCRSMTSDNKTDSTKHVNPLNELKTPNLNVPNKTADRTDLKDINKCCQDKNNPRRKSRYSSASKIPVSLTRLPCKEQSLISPVLISDNSNKYSQAEKSSPSKTLIEAVIRNSKEANEKDVAHSLKTFMSFENQERYLKETVTGCFMKNSKYSTSKSECSNNGREMRSKEEHMLSNPLNPVSNWLNENVYTDDKNKNVPVSRIAPNNDTGSVKKHRRVPRLNLNKKFSENSNLGDLKSSNEQSENIENSSSGTDASLEYYYDTETGNDTVTQDEDKNEWKEDSDDEDFIVTVPTSKSKVSDTSKKFIYQGLINDPDYPKTPYYLRYPRYKSKETDSIKKYAETPSTRQKTPKSKNRKKSLKSTPKKKRSHKSKKSLNFKKQDVQS